MAYEIINDKLKIKSCFISDLTEEQIEKFLGQWEDEAAIEELTLFYEYESGYIILNRDSKNYEFYLDVAEGYLLLNDEIAELVRNDAPESTKETLQILEDVRKHRFLSKELRINGHQRVVGFKDTFLGDFFQELIHKCDGSILLLMSQAYTYGEICGKREERARRKKLPAIC